MSNIDKKKIKILVIGILINVIGRFIASKTQFPGYLNLTGIVYASYYGGWLLGVITALISGFISSFNIAIDIYYVPIDMAMAIFVYLLSKKNRFFNRFLSVISLA
jgi:hypothetical protein